MQLGEADPGGDLVGVAPGCVVVPVKPRLAGLALTPRNFPSRRITDTQDQLTEQILPIDA